MEFDSLSKKILGCAIEVHRTLGPGLLESVYEQALAYELISNGLKIQTQLPVPVTYKAVKLDCLKLTGLTIGPLINFNLPLLKNGLKRFVL